MSLFRRRRRREDATTVRPEVSGRYFDDSRDVITPTGEPYVVGSTRSVPRRELPRDISGGVWGGPSPMYASVPRQRTVARRVVRLSQSIAPLQIAPPAVRLGVPTAMPFRVPSRVAVCVRRRVRKSVLFARGVAGVSGSAPGKRNRYRRTDDSLRSCHA